MVEVTSHGQAAQASMGGTEILWVLLNPRGLCFLDHKLPIQWPFGTQGLICGPLHNSGKVNLCLLRHHLKLTGFTGLLVSKCQESADLPLPGLGI